MPTAPASASSARRWAAGAIWLASRTARLRAWAISIGDTLAATYGCMGALAALHHREKTGRGQVVDSALYEAVLQVMESLLADYGASGHMRDAIRLDPSAHRAVQRLSVQRRRHRHRRQPGQSLPALLPKPSASRMGRQIRTTKPISPAPSVQVELDEMISEWTRRHTVAEVDAIMVGSRRSGGPIYRPDQMIPDPPVIARNAIHWEEPSGTRPHSHAECLPGSPKRPARCCQARAGHELGSTLTKCSARLLGIRFDLNLAELRRAGVIGS